MSKSNTKSESIVRKKYSPEFKDQAIQQALEKGVPQAAKDLGLSESVLYSWRAKQRRGGNSLEEQALQSAEMAQLKRDLKRLQEENAFLKKAAAYFAKEPK